MNSTLNQPIVLAVVHSSNMKVYFAGVICVMTDERVILWILAPSIVDTEAIYAPIDL